MRMGSGGGATIVGCTFGCGLATVGGTVGCGLATVGPGSVTFGGGNTKVGWGT
jgi:hypothetical protein